MPPIVTLAIKDLRLLCRDRAGLFFTLFFPILFAVFFGTVFSSGHGESRRLDIRIVDEDRTPASAAFIADITSGPEFTVKMESTAKAAEDHVLAGHDVAFIRIPPGFGERQSQLLLSLGGGGEKATVEIGVDPARGAQKAMIHGIMQKYAFSSLGRLFSDPAAMKPQLDMARAQLSLIPGVDPVLRQDLARLFGSIDDVMKHGRTGEDGAPAGPGPRANVFADFMPMDLQFRDVNPPDARPPNSYAVAFPQAAIWGVISCSLAFGISLVVEQQRGTLARLRIAPLRSWQVLLGKALACFTTVCIVCGAMFVIGGLLFGVQVAKPLHLALGIVSVATAFVGAMMLCACAGKTESAAAGIGWSVMMVFALTGGAAVPNVFMPEWVDPISNFSPVKWAIFAMEAGVWRPLPPAQMAMHCGVLIAIGVAGFLIGAWIFQRRAA